MSRIRGEFLSGPAAIPSIHSRFNRPDVAGADHTGSPFADQPTRSRRAKFSTRSAAAAALSAGLVIRAAISRARATYCGARIVRRSATSDFWVVVEKRRAVPTFSRLS